MKSIVPYLIVLLGTVCGLVIVRGAKDTESSGPKWFGYFLAFAIIAGSFWYFFRTGADIDDDAKRWIACRLDKASPGCTGPVAPPSSPPPPQGPPNDGKQAAPPPAPAPRPASQPPAPAPRPAGQPPVVLESEGYVDGWWRVGMPAPPGNQLGSDAGLWAWAERRPGACEPLRQHRLLYPGSAYRAERERRLAGMQSRTVNLSGLIRRALATTRVRGTDKSAENGQAAACIAVSRAPYIRGAAAGSCAGTAFADSTIDFRDSEARVIPGSCTCESRWFTGYLSCTVTVEPICTFYRHEAVRLERCV